MPIPERFILWKNDAPLNARDEVIDHIAGLIDEYISECDDDDQYDLNSVVSCMCCLSAIGNTYGGMTSGYYAKVEEWRKAVLQLFEWSCANRAENADLEDEKNYIYGVLNSLFEAVDRSLVPEAREPWDKC